MVLNIGCVKMNEKRFQVDWENMNTIFNKLLINLYKIVEEEEDDE